MSHGNKAIELTPAQMKGEKVMEGGSLLLRDDYPPSTREYLNIHENLKIVSMEVFRRPVSKMVTRTLDLLSAGGFSRAAKSEGYDKFYHVGIMGVLENGQPFVAEKTEVIRVGYPKQDFSRLSRVMVGKTTATLGEMLTKARSNFDNNLTLSGGYFGYDGLRGNNCQAFVKTCLQGIGLWTDTVREFVFQPMDEMAKKLPGYLKSMSKFVTDVAAVGSRVMEGRGLIDPNEHSQHGRGIGDSVKPRVDEGLGGSPLKTPRSQVNPDVSPDIAAVIAAAIADEDLTPDIMIAARTQASATGDIAGAVERIEKQGEISSSQAADILQAMRRTTNQVVAQGALSNKLAVENSENIILEMAEQGELSKAQSDKMLKSIGDLQTSDTNNTKNLAGRMLGITRLLTEQGKLSKKQADTLVASTAAQDSRSAELIKSVNALKPKDMTELLKTLMGKKDSKEIVDLLSVLVRGDPVPQRDFRNLPLHIRRMQVLPKNAHTLKEILKQVEVERKAKDKAIDDKVEYIINKATGRKIKKDGPTHKKILKNEKGKSKTQVLEEEMEVLKKKLLECSERDL
jgi:hypothetical protein